MGERLLRISGELLMAMLSADGSLRFKSDCTLPIDARIVDVSDAEMCTTGCLLLKLASAHWAPSPPGEPLPYIRVQFTAFPAQRTDSWN